MGFWEQSRPKQKRHALKMGKASTCRSCSSFSARPQQGEGWLRTTGPRPAPCRLIAAGTATKRCHQQAPTLRVTPSQQLLPPLTTQERRQRLQSAGGGRVCPYTRVLAPSTQRMGGVAQPYMVCPGPEQTKFLKKL